MEYVFVDDLHRYKRLKVTRACESCRRRKVKCDGGSGGSQTPCSSCRKLKIDCIFSNMAMKRTAPKTEQEQMDERLQRSENLLNKLDEEDSKQGRKGRMLKPGDVELPPEMFVLNEPPLPYHQIPSGCAPSPELANHLINLYFAHVHPYVPILHKESFLRRFNDKTNPLSPLLLYSIFAMGAKYSDDVNVRLDPMKPESAGFAYYNRARDLLDDFLDTPRLSTVQAQILMLKFQEGIRRPGFFFRSWLYFGVIIRMAQDLGLNRNFDKWNLNISREDMICRKRVWQICFLCDQFMSGAQGRDVVISLSNTDIELPHKEDYDEQEFQVQTQFVHLVRLAKILASVMLVIAPTGTGAPLQAWSANPKLQILDNALEAWLQALPPKLRCQQEIEASPNSLPQTPSSHFSGFINILYHTIVILLHRPYITSIDNNCKGSQQSSHHLNMCTLSANNISQIAQKMFEHWGPIVFQYPIRGGNYGVYCLVAASMIHLVNMSSPDIRISRLAHDHLLRTLGVLKVCVEHSAAWDLRDKVHGLEAAFSAQQSRQSVAMLFHPNSHPDSQNHMATMNGRSCKPVPKKRSSGQNTDLKSVETTNQQIISNGLPDNFSHYPQNASPPHFHERPLYILTENSQSDQQQFTSEPEQLGHFDFMTAQQSLDENTLLPAQLGQIPMTTSGINVPITAPTSGTFNQMLPLNNSKQIDINGTALNTGGTFWDTNPLFVWNQIPTTTQQMWSQNGGISPLSISTTSSANSPTGHQSPDHGSPASIEQPFSQSNTGSPVNSVVDPIIVASQNPEDLNVWYNN